MGWSRRVTAARSLAVVVALLSFVVGTLVAPVVVAAADEVTSAAQAAMDAAASAYRDSQQRMVAAQREADEAHRAVVRGAAEVREATEAEVAANAKAFAAELMLQQVARATYMRATGGSGDLALLVGIASEGPSAISDASSADMAWSRLGMASVADAQAAVAAASQAAERTKTAVTEYDRALSRAGKADAAVRRADRELTRAADAYERAVAVYQTAAAAQVCQSAGLTVGPSGNAQYVWATLRDHGFSAAAAAGVLGNLQQESNISPTAVQKDGPGMGLAQWSRGGRWDTFLAYARERGADPWKLRPQVQFLLQEMRGNWGDFNYKQYRKLRDPLVATVYFHDRFEVSADSASFVRKTRGGMALDWYHRFKGVDAETANPGLVADSDVYCNGGMVLPGGPASQAACPMVPQAFKDSFAAYTGFPWDGLSPNAQLMSRCVYANFPAIKIHGTYGPGHLPSWDRAIDFMMPSDCVNTATGPRTTTTRDLQLGTQLARYLLANHKQLGVDYLIWQDRIRNPGEHAGDDAQVPVDQWREDTYNNGDCNNTHFNHVHVSVYASTPTTP